MDGRCTGAGLMSTLLSPDDLSHHLRLSVATLADWRSQGKGPAYIKAGRRIWYPQEQVEKWLRTQLRETDYGTEKSGRQMALQVQGGRQTLRRNHRLGRHNTKQDQGAAG